MKQTCVLEQIAPHDEVPIASVEDDYALNVAIVYQDLAAREGTAEMLSRVTKLVGGGNIHVASWRIGDLTRYEILEDAIQSAIHADVIVIAVSAAGALPLDLCAWLDIWLPRRIRGGALVALVGLPSGEPGYHAIDIFDYLSAVARKGGLAFLPQQRLLPATPSGPFDIDVIPRTTEAVTRCTRE